MDDVSSLCFLSLRNTALYPQDPYLSPSIGFPPSSSILIFLQPPKLMDQKSEMFQTLMILITSRLKSYNKLPVNGKHTEVFWCICCGYWLDIPRKLGMKDWILVWRLQVEIVFWKASFELSFSNCHDF
ncbi:hypothetical protein HAX54_001865 [Datura stramonium]|uniref:Uncharacterized protein n=1 Tax=Datura stramonium TaxID=4076 RepID=A0ABS8T3Q7_DATST|nr:hypothetical protein [Datura stramonium]